MSLSLVALVAFVLMEPFAAGAHRLVMHGPGWGWHRSHHVGRHNRVEDNDRFPVFFAGATVTAMAIGALTGPTWLLGAGAGVTAYGAAYLFVHDVCVHGRLTHGRPLVRGRWLRWVAASHAVHHRTNRGPYGFLCPVPAGFSIAAGRRWSLATVAISNLGRRSKS